MIMHVQLLDLNSFQIIPTGEEMYPALLKFAEELSANPLKK